jgi:hypothetical protein
MKNSTASYSTIGSSIRKLSALSSIPILMSIASPAIATPSVEISSYEATQGKVKLKFNVWADGKVPIEGLTAEDFQLETNKSEGGSVVQFDNPNELNLLEPGQGSPDPANVIILLDMSGSMTENDASNKEKFKSAIDGIKRFIELIRTDKIPAQISLVPFGEKAEGSDCANTYAVNSEVIKSNFLNPTTNQPELEKQLGTLSSVTPCAATNLYDPLREAVEYLGKNAQPTTVGFGETIQPRQVVVLFSDGFHSINNRDQEPAQFSQLTQTLQQYPQVKVNTIGYGEPLTQLRDRTIDCQGISDTQLNQSPDGVDILRNCRLVNGREIIKFIMDQPRLSEIAAIANGRSLFPQTADEVGTALKEVFKSLRQYELEYVQPDAQPGDQYQIKLSVNDAPSGLNVTSEPFAVRLPQYGYQTLPLPLRVGIFIATIIGLGGTLLWFQQWSRKKKKEAERWV